MIIELGKVTAETKQPLLPVAPDNGIEHGSRP
jgi:hypothetical protein